MLGNISYQFLGLLLILRCRVNGWLATGGMLLFILTPLTANMMRHVYAEPFILMNLTASILAYQASYIVKKG